MISCSIDDCARPWTATGIAEEDSEPDPQLWANEPLAKTEMSAMAKKLRIVFMVVFLLRLEFVFV
jgi:hypothetical protein